MSHELRLSLLLKLLSDLRTTVHPNPSKTGIAKLDSLIKSHSQTTLNAKLAISGRGLPLLYHLINHLVSYLNGTIVLIDLDQRFSPSHLPASCPLQHIHVFRPTKMNLKVTLESIEEYMVYGDHESKGREWVGTIVNGGGGGTGGLGKGIDVTIGWRGWLTVEREEVGAFGEGVNVEEAWGDRERRQEVVESREWKAVCDAGEYSWR
jgi:hypothetical protein